ncbi:pyruvate kinase [candidate division KSB1 bacterium]|nr:pyruvate kinase [candidate division KSB1 bacterium]
MTKKSKIIATLGPASQHLEIIESLIQNGVNVFRLNFSHGDHETHRKTIQLIQTAAERIGYQPAILADLQGPKIRTGKTLNDAPVFLKAGQKISVTPNPMLCTSEIISISYPHLLADLEIGNIFLLNDGAVSLKVIAKPAGKDFLACEILNSGSYSSRKGVNFPHARLRISAITEKDRDDIAFILQENFHFIALSFVRQPSDLDALQKLIAPNPRKIRIIAKIEKPEAALQIDAILKKCDGIMVARGDLGVEVPLQDVPIIQKNLIQTANQQGKSVIVATQMLESMIEKPSPTRAEATDVANAILDGTDAVMLSGETAAGRYPVQTVATMRRIIEVAETSSYFPREMRNLKLEPHLPAHAMCEAAAWASQDLNHIPILVFTISGETAWYLSKIRPQAPIYAFSPDAHIVAQLALAWNVRAFHVPFEENLVKLISLAEEKLLSGNFIKQSDLVVILSGTVPLQGSTNFMRIKKIGEI